MTMGQALSLLILEPHLIQMDRHIQSIASRPNRLSKEVEVRIAWLEKSQMEQLRSLYLAAWTATYGPTLGQEFLIALLPSLDDPELKVSLG